MLISGAAAEHVWFRNNTAHVLDETQGEIRRHLRQQEFLSASRKHRVGVQSARAPGGLLVRSFNSLSLSLTLFPSDAST